MIEKNIDPENFENVIRFISNIDEFRHLDVSILNEFISSMTLIYLEAGETLIQQGELDQALYILWFGRLRVFVDNVSKGIAEISVGQIVGEMALLTDHPRTATVRAIRDSVVIKWSRELFQKFENYHPKGILQIAKTALKRLIYKVHPTQPGENIITITIAPSGDSNHYSFALRLSQELDKIEPTLLVTQEFYESHFRNRGFKPHREEPDEVVDSWLTSLENRYRYIIYQTDERITPWTIRCMKQADIIILVGEENASFKINSIEKILFSKEQEIIFASIYMVFIHAHEKTQITGTHNWLKNREIEGYHHLRLGSNTDFAKLIRFLTGRALGVVLSGGGARGIAHAGVLKAFEELKIPIDCIGGSSIGGAIAGLYAKSGINQLIEFCEHKDIPKISHDYTFPFISLLKGKNLSKLYQHLYEDTYIEDLWTPFFCVSSDLTQSKLSIHERGLLWLAIRASSSLPGIYPPIYDDEGNMLVDGGIVNNMPVNIMRKFLSGGKILGVNCYIKEFKQPKKKIKNQWVSGWKIFWENCIPFNKRKYEYDNIFKILRASFLLSASDQQKRMAKEADFMIELETSKYKILQFQDAKKMIEIGYRMAMEKLPILMEHLDN